MELMRGGDLFDRIGKKKSYTEADARELCIKMLEAVKFCHINNVAHCDMKPKNLLLEVSRDNQDNGVAVFCLFLYFSIISHFFDSPTFVTNRMRMMTPQ